jgi:hypothetical protein
MFRSKRKGLSIPLLAMTALVLPVTAYAAELNTSPLWADNGQSYHACNVANVLTSSVALTISVINSSGVLIATSNNITLAAGTSVEINTDEHYTGFAYCHIDLPNEAGNTVRADLTVLHFTGSFYDTLATSQAR